MRLHRTNTARRIVSLFFHLSGCVAALGCVLLLTHMAMAAPPAATFPVDDSADAIDAAPGDGTCATPTGACTLRAAVMEANALPGQDVIVLSPLTYTLTISGAGEDAALSGDLDITDTLVLIGAGPQHSVVDGGGLDRVLDVMTGIKIYIIQITIQNGSASFENGGGLRNAGTISLVNTQVISNQATSNSVDGVISGGMGGGLANSDEGRMALFDTQVLRNVADNGGGIYSSGELDIQFADLSNNRSGFGGAISNDGGRTTVTTSVISDNRAFAASGAGIFNTNGALIVANSIISNNMGFAGHNGGGIANLHGTVMVTNTTVYSNYASWGGGLFNQGVMTVTQSLIENNQSGQGGGLLNGSGAMALIDVRIIGNSAIEVGGGLYSTYLAQVNIFSSTIQNNDALTAGGGIHTDGAARLSGVSIISNFATTGGGILNGGITEATQSAIIGNQTLEDGAGIYHWDGELILANSTISNNKSNNNGGAIAQREPYASVSLITLTNTTIASNTAAGLGSGIYSEITGAITLTNVLLAHNPGGDCAGAPLASLGHNLASDATCALNASGDMTSTNPLIAPLDTSTWTHTLLPGSPAIDHGDMAACPPVDQRGHPRPAGNGCDIGAYEAALRWRYLPLVLRTT